MILIIISSKAPNPFLFDCIDSLYKIQIKDSTEYKICVIDSDSDDKSNYEKINFDFPDVDIIYAKNKNYEYGAWKCGFDLYPNCDIYFTLQDSMRIKTQIDINLHNAFIWENNTGFNSHLSIKEKGKEYLKLNGLNYKDIDENFKLTFGNIFIVNNAIMKDIFHTLTIPPIDKVGSCVYERIFGLYFISRNINTVNIGNYLLKINGGRI